MSELKASTPAPEPADGLEGGRRNTFIHDLIDADLQRGRYTEVVTRFPPEPNGYLHIGHAKSIVLNYGLAQEYAGRFHLRFDDTNPLTEDVEYVESIKRDVAWLGAEWGEHLYFASDYFEQMYERAVHLIRRGLAYVDSQTVEEIRENRGTLTEPGKESPYRNRSVEENLELFERMRAGEFEDGEVVLRAKIDMGAANMLMRDPLLYRVRHARHHNTGDAWCIYPMYDYAHCLEDAFEGVTHSICTLEFENNRELYDWVIRETEVESKPRQIEFARLNLTYTVMSKRKLLQLVQDGHVAGWDDPRMPTIAAMRRRGVRPEALRRFSHMIGVAKANSTVDYELLEFAIRDDLNAIAPRVMGVLRPLKVTITNYPEGKTEALEAPYFPAEVADEAADAPFDKTSREVPFGREIYIERDDFAEEPPKGWHRLAPGAEVRLRYAYFIRCEEVVRDASGEVVELRCTYDPATLGGSAPDGRKVRGTLHWVSAEHSLPATVRLYDRLFVEERPDAAADVDFKTFINPDSLVTLTGCRVEPAIADNPADTRYQFERQGYFWRDPVDGQDGDELVFNRIVGLRDSWGKGHKKAEPAKADRQKTEKAEAQKGEAQKGEAQKGEDQKGGDRRERPGKKRASYERDNARAADPELAARLARYQHELGLTYDNADLLTGDRAASEFFEAALATYDRAATLAPYLVNEVLPLLDDEQTVDALGLRPEHLARLVELIDADRITNQASREVLAVMREGGDADPDTIVRERGLEKLGDADALEPIVDQVIAAHPDNVARYREGKTTLIGFFVGQVMKATGGKADAVLARELLEKKLG